MRNMSADQLRPGMTISRQPFLLREKSLNTTRAGSQLLRVLLADQSGTIAGVYFDVPAYVAESLTEGRGVEVSGRVGEFRDRPQVKIDSIRSTSLDELDAFLPSAHRDREEMEQELQSLIAGVSNDGLSRLLRSLFGDASLYDQFVTAPAAKTIHHACVSGLLEHTLAVARLTQAACSLYPEMDRDLAITLALLHDLGKVEAYDRISFGFTEEGAMLGHLYMSARRVEHELDQLEGFCSELRLKVVHGILAHHGQKEYGSPVVPMTLEAIVVHHADLLDSTTRGAIDHLDRSHEGDSAFTKYNAALETRLYRGGTEAEEAAPW